MVHWYHSTALDPWVTIEQLFEAPTVITTNKSTRADPILLPYSQRVHCAYERVERLQCELCVEFRLNSEIVAFVVFEFPLPSESILLMVS